MDQAAWYGMYALTKREIARYLNVWGQTVVPPILTSALMLFVFGHALGSRVGDFDGVDYLSFIVPGLVMQGAIINAYSNTSSSLFDARRAGYIDDVLASPLRDWQIVVAYMVSAATRGLLVAALTILIAVPFAGGWDVAWGLLALVLVGSSLLFAAIGLLAGLGASRWDHVLTPVSFVLAPLTMLGGMFYPVSLLPPVLETLSRFNPLLYVVDAARGAMLGTNELPMLPSVAMILVLTAAMMTTALVLFARSDKLRG